MYPWCDPSGRFSVFKLTVFVLLLVPGCFILWPVIAGGGATIPVKEAILESGDWAIRMVLISLLITPLRRMTRASKLVQTRRQVGLAALGYGLTHLMLYALTQSWDVLRIANEILARIYLTIGFVALTGLVILGATSTKSAMRKLGKNWARLHKASYGIGVLAAVHFFMQSKIDVSEATLMAGFFVALMLYRVAHARDWSLRSPLVLVMVAVVSGLMTAGIEYAWYGLATGVPPSAVLAANFEVMWPLRPAWNVLLTGLFIAVVSLFGRDAIGREWVGQIASTLFVRPRRSYGG
ncbi:sulfite oxidase heme-binding subunit YedZ [Thalassospira alkalitolerans]|uniref:sulfite oxidase heme-binding subunit YedZ n=1 Tax=Thalassospira alkalitolerans TaxID=1293890 RepID=UPI003AA84238